MSQSSSAPRDADEHQIHRTALTRVGRVGLWMLAAITLVGGSAALAGTTGAAPAVAADYVCTGVTVVVDSTDIGGELAVVCAEGEQETGRAALTAAGFTTTDSQPGFLCAINSMPDPCPEVFDGNFWSYWHSAPDGEWESYQVGADSSTPAVGSIEGWRYNDGTTPPGITPSDVRDAVVSPYAEMIQVPNVAATPDEMAPQSDEAVTTTLADQQAAQATVLTIVAVSFLALIAAFVVFFMVRRRRNGEKPGTGSSD